jgi:hypothetical protein
LTDAGGGVANFFNNNRQIFSAENEREREREREGESEGQPPTLEPAT